MLASSQRVGALGRLAADTPEYIHHRWYKDFAAKDAWSVLCLSSQELDRIVSHISS